MSQKERVTKDSVFTYVGREYSMGMFAQAYTDGNMEEAIHIVGVLCQKGRARLKTTPPKPEHSASLEIKGKAMLKKIPVLNKRYSKPGMELTLTKQDGHCYVKHSSWSSEQEITNYLKSILREQDFDQLIAVCTGELEFAIFGKETVEYEADGIKMTASNLMEKFNLENNSPLFIQLLNSGVIKKVPVQQRIIYEDQGGIYTRQELIKKYNLGSSSPTFIDSFLSSFSSNKVTENKEQRIDDGKVQQSISRNLTDRQRVARIASSRNDLIRYSGLAYFSGRLGPKYKHLSKAQKVRTVVLGCLVDLTNITFDSDKYDEDSYLSVRLMQLQRKYEGAYWEDFSSVADHIMAYDFFDKKDILYKKFVSEAGLSEAEYRNMIDTLTAEATAKVVH